MNSKSVSDQPESQDTREFAKDRIEESGKSRRTCGCILVSAVVLIGLLVAANLIYTKWYVPRYGEKVDPNLSDPEIKIGKDDSGPITEGILAGFTKKSIDDADHPLEPAIALAQRGLEQMNTDVQDYTATLVKQIRYKGKLLEVDHLEVKIRHKQGEGDDAVPFSVYTKMLKPQRKLGIEAIYVENWNDNNIAAHPNFPVMNPRLNLPVDGFLAMQEQLHPITMIGMKNLLRQTIEKGERDLNHDECEVAIHRGVEIDGRKCLMIKITHPEPRDHFEFHIAKIYIDIERELPIGYEGYLWPEEEGGKPLLFEKYIYTNLEVNAGLDDEDFDPANEAYNFPG